MGPVVDRGENNMYCLFDIRCVLVEISANK